MDNASGVTVTETAVEAIARIMKPILFEWEEQDMHVQAENFETCKKAARAILSNGPVKELVEAADALRSRFMLESMMPAPTKARWAANEIAAVDAALAKFQDKVEA